MECVIKQSIQGLEKRIVTEGLPASGYAYADAPGIAVYLNPDLQKAKYEGWILVKSSIVFERIRGACLGSFYGL